MPAFEDLQRRLAASRESRRRAWLALQGVREVLALASDSPLPAVSRPPRFETEGRVLRHALVETLATLTSDIEALESAIARVRPFLTNSQADSSYPHAVVELNRATGKARVSTKELRQLLSRHA